MPLPTAAALGAHHWVHGELTLTLTTLTLTLTLTLKRTLAVTLTRAVTSTL